MTSQLPSSSLPSHSVNNNNNGNDGSGINGNSMIRSPSPPVTSSPTSAGSSTIVELDDPAPGLYPMYRTRAQSFHGSDTTNNTTNVGTNGSGETYGGGTHVSAAAQSASAVLQSTHGIAALKLHSGSATPVVSAVHLQFQPPGNTVTSIGNAPSTTSSTLSPSSSSSSLNGASNQNGGHTLNARATVGNSIPRSSSHRHIDDSKERKRQPSSSSSRSRDRDRDRGQSFASNSGDDYSAPGTPAGSGNGGFECNICLDQSREPVTTLCGHLFCWPCLWRWLEDCPQPGRCPVCKAAVTKDTVIPLYARGGDSGHGMHARARAGAPQRPPGRRPATPPPPGEWPYGRASQELHWSPFLAQAREAAVEGHGGAAAAHGHHGHISHAHDNNGIDDGDGAGGASGTSGNSGASAQAAAVVMAAAAADHALGFGVPSLFSMQAGQFGGPDTTFFSSFASAEEGRQARNLSILVALWPLFVLIFMFQ